MSGPDTAWLFPGQGSQYVGMGWDLLREFSPAAEIMEQASALSGKDLQKLCLQGPDALLTRTDNLQPAITAINLGCARLLQDRGFRPAVVAGHSLGEFAALYAAGVLTVRDTLYLVTERGRLMHETARQVGGGMLAVKGLTAAQVEHLLAGLQSRFVITIANYNAPTQTVLSGAVDGLEQAQAAVSQQGGVPVRLNVSGPWHSSLMQAAAERFNALLADIDFQPAQIPVVLNVTGEPCQDPQAIKAVMLQQLCSPVRWRQTLQTMLALGVQRFIEVGPGKVLRGLLRSMQPAGVDYPALGVDGPKSLRFLSQRATA